MRRQPAASRPPAPAAGPSGPPAWAQVWRNHRVLVLNLLLAALTVLVYGRTVGFAFLEGWDDGDYVTRNPHVQAGLTADGLRWAFTTTHTLIWQPATWLSFQLDHDLFGTDPAGFHAVNVLLHVLNALVLFGLLRRLTGAAGRSFFVAGLFALHPLHVESVAWVAERKDVLSTCFGLFALWAYARHAERPGVGRYLLVALALTLGLLAKSMLVTLPAVMLLLDYWPLRRFTGAGSPGVGPPTSWARLVAEKVPLLVPVAVTAAMAWHAQHQATGPSPDAPPALRLETAAVAYATYLEKTVWPAGLVPFYPYPRELLPPAQVAIAVGLLAAVTVLAVGWRRRSPYLVVGWLWYLGTLVPVIGLVHVIGGHAMADRYTYVPLVGIFLMAVWGLADLAEWRRLPPWAAPAAGAVALAACVVVSWVQVGHWRDEATLWDAALRADPDNYMAHLNRGTALCNAGRLDEGTAELERAVALQPDYPLALHNLGLARLLTGNVDGARAVLAAAVERAPRVGRYRNTLGLALFDLGRSDEAAEQFAQAARLDPDTPEHHFNLAVALEDRGDPAGAAAEYRAGLAGDPSWPERAFQRAQVLLQNRPGPAGQAEEALLRARQANGATGGRHPEALAVVAEAYAATGRTADAVAAARRAKELAAAAGNEALAGYLDAAIRRYEAGRPKGGR